MPQLVNELRKVAVLVLGAGVAGLAAAKVLRESGTEYLIIEKKSEIFGHAKSHRIGDFVFDEGPHILFGRNEKLSNFAGAPISSAFEFKARPGNIWDGHLINHPIYLDFSSLPKPTFIEIADSLSEIRLNLQSNQNPKNYEEWLDLTQGKYIRTKFTEVYNQKYWRTATKELDTDWLGNRVHAISIEQQNTIRSYRDSSKLHTLDLTQNSYYVTQYAYSAEGFQDLFPSLIDESTIKNCEVFEIDVAKQIAATSLGYFKYERLISTIPLTEFVRISTPKPPNLDAPMKKLKVTSFVCDNFIIKGSISKTHDFTWIYSYDEDFLPARISFPTRLHSKEGHEGKFSLQTETYFMKDS
jgi:UDP-galactopyranose mutase